MNLNEWRNKHHKCAWCVYCEKQEYTEVNEFGFSYDAVRYYCTGKLRVVGRMTPRPFCRLFEQKIEHVLTDETEADIVSKFSPAGRELYYKIVYPEREN